MSATSSGARCVARARITDAPQDRGRHPDRSADAEARSRCCSSRCCSTCSTTPPNMRRAAPRSDPGLAGSTIASSSQIMDEGPGIPPADLGAHLRQVLPGAQGRPARAGTGLGPVDLPRLRRGDGRNDRRGEPDRPAGRGVHHHHAACRPNGPTWTDICMTNAARDDPHRRRRAADPQAAARRARRPGLRHQRGAVRQGGDGAGQGQTGRI